MFGCGSKANSWGKPQVVVFEHIPRCHVGGVGVLRHSHVFFSLFCFVFCVLTLETRSPSSALLPFLGEGSPARIDYRQKVGALILTSLLEASQGAMLESF